MNNGDYPTTFVNAMLGVFIVIFGLLILLTVYVVSQFVGFGFWSLIYSLCGWFMIPFGLDVKDGSIKL